VSKHTHIVADFGPTQPTCPGLDLAQHVTTYQWILW